MAATKRGLSKSQQEQVRSAIQTTQLVKRLQGFALGEKENRGKAGEDPKPIEIDPARLRAIEILLRKSLPDLQAVTVSGDPDNPIKTEEVGAGAAKLAAFIDGIAERSAKAGGSDA